MLVGHGAVSLAKATALAAVTAAAIVWLAAGLPAGAFFSGDSGLKLIAAREAIAHPDRPFEIDLPRIGERATPFVDPMVIVHGSHAHALQSPLFPPLSAPFIAAFGLRGAYVLPALAFVALYSVLEVLRRLAVPEASPLLLAWLAIAANPVLFYALEYWEHAPAVALLAAGTAAVALAVTRGGSSGLAAAGGALVGAGVLLRPEGAWYAAGLLVTLARPRWLAFGAGAAAMAVPFATANYLHFGNPIGAHASAVLGPIGVGFAEARWARAHAWLWPASTLEWSGLLLVTAAWLSTPWVKDLRVRQLTALLGIAIVTGLAAQRRMPEGALWQGFPLALLALVPAASLSRDARRLYVLAATAAAGVVLTATNDGGAQWGVRYLLIAAPPLLLLAARAATDAAGAGRWRALRLAAVGLICLAGAMTSRAAFLELRGTKRSYDGLVTAVAAFTPPGRIVLTNAWWLDQVAGRLHGSRTFLFVNYAPAAAHAIEILGAERIDDVTLAWTTAGEAPFPLEAALDGTCFRIATVRDMPLRELRLASVRCDSK
jgi:hypothetical protein